MMFFLVASGGESTNHIMCIHNDHPRLASLLIKPLDPKSHDVRMTFPHATSTLWSSDIAGKSPSNP